MLEHAGAGVYEPLIARAPAHLEMPRDAGARPAGGRGAGAAPIDQRRTARIPTLIRAAAEVSQPLEAIPRGDTRAQVWVRDVSLRGIRFLYHEQLYPGERIRLWVPEAELSGEVARTLRVGERCYEIGARLDAAIPAKLLKRLLAARRMGS